MTTTKRILPLAIAASLTLAAGSAPVLAADSFSERGIIGKIVIDFDARKNQATDGQPKPGITDKYSVDLNVSADSAFRGEIVRTPQIAGSVGIKQGANMEYKVDLIAFNPANRAQTMSVGRWVGDMPIGSDGLYQLAKDKGASLRFAMTMKGGADSGNFEGTIQGRKLGKAKLFELAQQVTDTVKKDGATKVFTRVYQGKPMSVQATNTDPMKFNNVVLAAGPAAMYGRVTVNGEMIYDYDSDTWFLDGMTFRYQDKDKPVTDKVGGTIRWLQDDNGANGRYELNITFNEPAVASGAPTDASGFFAASDNSAAGFFAMDDSLATCGGKVLFKDDFMGGDAPVRSNVEHQIQCNDKVTEQQVMAFAKLWLLGIGPLTDE